MMKIENKKEIENTALQLKALLTVLSTADTDNAAALAEMPHALEIAANMADSVYCAITEAEEMEV